MRYVFIALLLAGCVATPQELTETGTRSAHSLNRAPDEATGCIARNVENERHYQTTIRAMDSGRELVVRSDVHNLAVAHVTPAVSGSHATIWVRPMFMGRDDFVRAAVKGC